MYRYKNELTSETTHAEVVAEDLGEILLEDAVDLIGTEGGGNEGVLAVSELLEGRGDLAHELLVGFGTGEDLLDLVDRLGRGAVGEVLEELVGGNAGGEGTGTDGDDVLGSLGGPNGGLGGTGGGGEAGSGQGDAANGTGNLLRDLDGGLALGSVGHLQLGEGGALSAGGHVLGGEGRSRAEEGEGDEGSVELHFRLIFRELGCQRVSRAEVDTSSSSKPQRR